MEAPGGGSRILRVLYSDCPDAVVSIATTRAVPPPCALVKELYCPLRPGLGRIDGSRYGQWGHTLELALAPLAAQRLERVFKAQRATAVHAVAHSPAFWPAFRAARALKLPFLLSIHDDLRYLLRNTPLREVALARLGRVWRQADSRFVISAAIGDEYNARYGRADYAIVTDGLTEADFLPGPEDASSDVLRAYFAGLFHRGYRPNLRAFVSALDIVAGAEPAWRTSLTCRCGELPERPPAKTPVRVLRFGSQADVRRDLAAADLLYLPLMLEEEYRDMVAFSLSTKLVTYLASGVPILYHGPRQSAAYDLLAEHDAAILAASNEPAEIAQALRAGMVRADEIVANARRLAREEFMLDDQRARFWAAVPTYTRAWASRRSASRASTSRTNAVT
jgi:hypothetical protein